MSRHKNEEDIIWELEQEMLPVEDRDCFICRGKRTIKFHNGTNLRNILCPECDGKGNLLSCVGLMSVFKKGETYQLCNEYDEHVVRCSECNEEMDRKSGELGEFLGCGNYPHCKSVRLFDALGRVELPLRLVEGEHKMIRS